MNLSRAVRSQLLRLLPEGAVYGDGYLTGSGRLLVRRLVPVAAAVVLLGVAVVLLSPKSWADVTAGALFAWGVAILVWACSSYVAKRDAGREQLLHDVDTDLLHARLNHIAAKVGAPTLGLSWQLAEAHLYWQERMAHLTGREEYRPDAPPAGSDGVRWWDRTALSDPDMD